MRHDMKRVIIETRRIHDIIGRSRTVDVDDMDELPTHEPMRVHRSKLFGDRLSPLINYLEKQVGRPWNDVWSEICQSADRRSVDGWHLREHVRSAVKTHAHGWGSWFFVDDDGILRALEGESFKQERKRRIDLHRKAKRKHSFSHKGRQYEKINGCWFEILTKTYRVFCNRRYVTETVHRKQQLSRKRLAKLGLKNDNQAS